MIDEHRPARLPGRGLILWPGGKGNMVGRLTSLVPYDHLYLEPFAGAMSLLMNRRPSPVEAVNDLSREIVTLARVLQDDALYADLERRLRYTLYHRDEFRRAIDIREHWEEATDVDRAWAVFVSYRQGFSGIARTEGHWGRAFISNRGRAATTSKWQSALDLLPDWHARLARVQIDQIDALEFIRYWDRADAVIYCDPPYPMPTRIDELYEHEMTLDDHEQLVETLLSCEGLVVLSCYDHSVYQPLCDAGWERFAFETALHMAGKTRQNQDRGEGSALRDHPRTEVVYRSRSPAGGGRQRAFDFKPVGV
jgi:DNA adenine methylase